MSKESRIKTHSFDIKEAEQLGSIEKAIILQNLRFWLDKNRCNERNAKDGFYWTYNSANAFSRQFPYMKLRSINRWLSELENDGIIKSSKSYNKIGFDQTKWYTIPAEYSIGQNDQSNRQNGQSNGQNGRPIPDTETYVITNGTPNPKGKVDFSESIPENLNSEDFKAAWQDWIQARKEAKKKLTPSAAKRQLKMLSKMGPQAAIASIEQSITNQWQGLFEPKQEFQAESRPQPQSNGPQLPDITDPKVWSDFKKTMKGFDGRDEIPEDWRFGWMNVPSQWQFEYKRRKGMK